MAVKSSASSLTASLRAITDAAQGLRAAGVTRVVVGEVAADLAPAPAAPTRVDKEASPDPVIGDLDDFLGGAAGRSRRDSDGAS